MEERFSCDCKGCTSACKVKPGWMLPGEAEKIAEYLGITLKELFDSSLLVDYYLSSAEGHKYLLSPGIKNKETGTMTPSDPRGTCVFLDENEHCQIHEVAPYECREMKHHQPANESTIRHKWVAEQWHNEKDYEQLIDLLGRKPEVPEMDTSTFLELLMHAIKYK